LVSGDMFPRATDTHRQLRESYVAGGLRLRQNGVK
jgi:hypothetical protein